MLILLSPAKTFVDTEVLPISHPVFLKEAERFNNKLRKYAIKTIASSMKISLDLAKKVKSDTVGFQKEPKAAIFSYHGQAYRGFDVASFSNEELLYLKDHILILSGLYGIIRPLDGITPYRLDIKDKIFGNLYQFWKPRILSYLKEHHQHDLIINLASHEYSGFIKSDIPMITIGFEMPDRKITNMELKLLRGQMAKRLIKDRISDAEEIKKIRILGYAFNSKHSSDDIYMFTKEDKTNEKIT